MATKVGKRFKTSVYVGKENGKRKYEVFYADKAWEADAAAERYKKNRERKATPAGMTVGEAIDGYIASRDAALSPATIAPYKSMREYRFQSLMDVPLCKVNNRVMQSAVNEEAKKLTEKGKPIKPKTVKNAAGMIISAIRYYEEDAKFKIVYPETIEVEYATPDAETLKRIFTAVRGTRVELPVLLAAWLSLSASEILGLKWSDIHDDYLSINGAMVYTSDGGHYKVPKERTRKRNILIDPILRDKLRAEPKSDGEFIFTITRNQLYKSFVKILKDNDIPHCRFHDLRHANASIMALLNIPDKYAQERGGWATDHIMKAVYQQTFTAEQKQFAEVINGYVRGLLHTDLHTDK